MTDNLIIIPAYNESQSLPGLLDDIGRHCPEWDVLVINDCSSDDTTLVLDRAGVRHLDLAINLGIGGAMQAGYRWARQQGYAYAVQCDGDGQHPVNAILELYETMCRGGADMVIGSRFCRSSEYEQTPMRMIGIRLLRWAIRHATGIRVSDPTSGFRMVNKRLIALFADDYPSDYPEVDTVVQLLLSGMKVAEVAVTMNLREHGRSSISPLKSAFYMAKVPFAVLLMYRAHRRAGV